MENERLYQKDWLMWLLFGFFSPAGIVLMWINKRYKKGVRLLVSILYFLFFISEYGSIKNGKISSAISIIIVFVLIPYLIVHWKNISKKDISYNKTRNNKLTTCKSCGHQVAIGAKICPNCGKDQRIFFQRHMVLTSIIAIILFIAGISLTYNNKSNNPQTTTSSNSSVDDTNELNNSSSISSTDNSTSSTDNVSDTSTTDTTTETSNDNGAISEGMYKIGSDISAGEYVVIANDDSGAAYIELSKDSSGNPDSIIGNENVVNRTYVTANTGEYLTVKSAIIYPISKAPAVDKSSGTLPDGMYKVGVDLQPGEYKINSPGDGYDAITTNSKHTMDGIVSNDNFNGDKYVTLQAGQYLELKNATLRLK